MHIRAVTMAEKPTSLIADGHVLEGRHTRLGLVSSLLKRENLFLIPQYAAIHETHCLGFEFAMIQVNVLDINTLYLSNNC